MADRAGHVAGVFQIDRGTTVPQFGPTEINPEVSGRGSNARADRGGPQQVVIVVRWVPRHVAQRPSGRTLEGLAQVMDRARGDAPGLIDCFRPLLE